MKKIAFLVGLIVALVSCRATKVSTTIETEKAQVELVLNSWHKAAAKANFENYFNSMTNTSVFIGTDASENWDYAAFKKFSKPFFDNGKAWSFKAIERNIYFNSDQTNAWFDELLTTHMGICRGSGVLVKDKSTWKLQHYVLSLTIPNNNIEQIKAINKAQDSLFLKKHDF